MQHDVAAIIVAAHSIPLIHEERSLQRRNTRSRLDISQALRLSQEIIALGRNLPWDYIRLGEFRKELDIISYKPAPVQRRHKDEV